jgi:hypothetical protein
LVSRGGWFGRLTDILIPFLVTRQLICGAGAVVLTPRGTLYGLSRWAGHTGNGLPAAATRSRPLISTSDEAQAAAAGGRRLRVSVSDPTMSGDHHAAAGGSHRSRAAHDRGGHRAAGPDPWTTRSTPSARSAAT